MKKGFFQVKREQEANKKRILELNYRLTDESGIYILYREENGIKYAYVGQALHLLTRLAQHLSGFQHIDLSIKKHGLHTERENGYKVHFELCGAAELDEKERWWIKYMADRGYQLRNHTIGGQGEGKGGFDNQKPPKGYHDGLAQGRKSIAKELKHIIDTHHLQITAPQNNKITQKALAKFWKILNYEERED